MKKLLILLASTLFASGMAVANELEIINLKHRSAEELLPIIQPLLGKDEVASGMNYQLILRASPHNIEQIKRLLNGIDTMPRRLKITVMQDVDSDTASRLLEVSGRLGKNVTLGQNGQAGARIISTRSLEDDKKTQQLQVLEGARARISTGQSVPVRQEVQGGWGGTQVITTTQYRDVSSGFYVLPRVNGDNVTLEVSSQNDMLAPNQGNYPTTRIQSTSSILSGRLGEWIELGGTGQQGSVDTSTITTRSTSRQNEQRSVLIKVDAVD